MKDYVAIATQYVKDVVSGKISACHWVRQACKRQLNDLVRFSQLGSPYYFSDKEASAVCKFVELNVHVKGKLAGERFRLEPWQVFILTTVFGWRRTSDGGRRYRRVYIEVPRGNGKSALSSAVALYCLLCDREGGAEVYSFATTRDQAKIVFQDAQSMCLKNKELTKHFGIEVTAHSIYVPNTSSSFQAKSADAGTLDGLNTHFACIDELHAHKTNAVYEVVETSMGKRFNSLLWVITTAGFDEQGVCYQLRKVITDILDGTFTDERQFGIIYTIDEEDDWRDINSAIKSNPNWGISVRPEHIQDMIAKAVKFPAAAPGIKTKHLNIWCSARSAWLNMVRFNQLSELLSEDDYYDCPCYIGLDLSSKSDVTARVKLYKKNINGEDHYYVFPFLYLPSDTIDSSENKNYQIWYEQGDLIATPGGVIDYRAIEDDLMVDLSSSDVRYIAYDPWNATQLALDLSENGAPMAEYRNSVQNMSEPMKWIEALMNAGRIHFCKNPMFAWMASNVVARTDAKDNIFPRKEAHENKIDGIVALIFAMGVALRDNEDDGGSFEEFANNMIIV